MIHQVRVRFAPSPTGPLHLGGLRTALFNYLFAKSKKGSFILRIEDTDQKRAVKGSVDGIIKCLNWCGIIPDEGPDPPYEDPNNIGPFYQSKRLLLYQDYIKILLQHDCAYKCFCSKERLASLKNSLFSTYDKKCSYLSQRQQQELTSQGNEFIIRFRASSVMPAANKRPSVEYKDLILSKLSFPLSSIEDAVLIKSDGFPTYHFANVVDDHLMKISHVLRGNEWISSTPLHLLLYKSFDWTPPEFGHLSLLLDEETKLKLSKRNSNAFVGDYKNKGIFPEALVNFISLLGWNPGTKKEIYQDINELSKDFSIEGLNKADSVVSHQRLLFFNKKHLEFYANDPQKLRNLAETMQAISKEMSSFPLEYICEFIKVIHSRISNIEDAFSFAPYFFKEPSVMKIEKGVELELLKDFKIELQQNFTKESIEDAVAHIKAQYKDRFPSNEILLLLRRALTGANTGASLLDTIVLIGSERILKRLDRIILENENI